MKRKIDKDSLRESLSSLLEGEAPISFAYLYGSFVECDAFNDIDIGIYVDTKKIQNFFDYEFELETKLTAVFPKIDVRIINNSPLGFKYSVIKGEVLVDHDPLFRCTFVERIVEEYLDLLPFREETLKYAAK